jgi:U4/U6 small nuclear ribonucleoprotein PRP31
MSGFADELLADLEDHSGKEDQEEEQPLQSDLNALKRKAADSDHDMSAEDDDDEQPNDSEGKRLEVGTLVLEGGIKPAEELDVEDVQRMELGAIEDVNKIAKLEGSKRMTDILKVRRPSSILTHF